MKRKYMVAAPILAATGLAIQEAEQPICQHESCAVETVSSIPEQPHASEEPPIFTPFTATHVIAGSPAVYVLRDSDDGREWTKIWNDAGIFPQPIFSETPEESTERGFEV